VERLKYIPGPGNYKIPGVIGKDGPSLTMHSTIQYSPEKKENLLKPGPGNYNPNLSNVKKNEPAYKLGTSKRNNLDFEKMTKF
jgi:hypothetical protein